MPTQADNNTDYINTTDYKKLERKILDLKDVSYDLTNKSLASRRLRYAEVDIEAERVAGKLAPDEMLVPQHIIDTNIRREQSAYIRFITQSPRAVILKDLDQASFDLALLEQDLTEKLRYDGWQLPAYANIDGFQANGYSVIEVTQELDNPGNLGTEYVQLGDFSFIADTRDLQKCEMVGRAYYFTKTKLLSLSKQEGEEERWDSEQVKKLLDTEPNDEQTKITSGTATKNQSLYKIFKIMFRIKGIVQVAWAAPNICDDWLRKPRPLFLGRRKINQDAAKSSMFVGKVPSVLLQRVNPELKDSHIAQIKAGLPPSDEEYETQYPYFLYPYLISENNTIACLKGRVFLDQDTQNAATSLLSSTLTQARRAAGLYFSKDTSDPNDDFLMQKNVFFKQGSLINGKIKEFKLDAPQPGMFQAINLLVAANQQETSQVNFAETNRQSDSRKTATAIKASMQQQQQLSGVQVTLFSVALCSQYTYMCEIIKSRVLTGLIKVTPVLQQIYARNWKVKPSGDVDVIEKQKMVETMERAWPVIQNTAAAQIFLSDLLEKLFPDNAAKYIAAIQQYQQQQNSAQQQQLQQMIGIAKQTAQGIIKLADEPSMFSETGMIHAYPIVKSAAEKFQTMMNGGQ